MNGQYDDECPPVPIPSGAKSASFASTSSTPIMNSISIEPPGTPPTLLQHSPPGPSGSSGGGSGSGAPSPNTTTSLPVTARKNGSWCSCPGSVSTSTENHSVCPVCLAKYGSETRIPMGLTCAHLVCLKCVRRLYPVGADSALPNIALLAYLDYPPPPLPRILDPECLASIFALRDIALLLKSHVTLSRAIHRKVLHLITSLASNSGTRLCRAARGVGERVLVELVSSCSHLSHYQAQQQLWAAIRARACQFMGPAMQEEALKLVLLALEDGSALSRKVLVMFVVQRLSPQFPQASKTSIGHVIQLLYRASCFDVQKRADTSSLMTLRPEYRCYEALRKEHDAQIVKIALESGIRFSPEQWSSILYGDNTHKPHMQSIIDKLLAPQSFTQMVTEFLVNIQRLTDPEDAAFLYSIHPHFQSLSNIDLQPESPGPPWRFVHDTLDSVSAVLIGLVTFNPKAPSKATVGVALSHCPGGVAPPPTHYQLQQSRSLSLGPPDPRQRSHRPLLRVGNILQPQPSPTRRGLLPLGRQHSAPVTTVAPPHAYAIAQAQGHTPGGPPPPQPQPPSMSMPMAPEANPGQIDELLAESRLLRAKMKILQDQIPTETLQQLELQAEADGLEEAACSMVQKLNV